MLAFFLAVHAPASIDPAAMALLKKNRDAMLALRGYRAECRTATKNLKPSSGHPPQRYEFATLIAAKPNLMRYDMWEPKGLSSIVARPATTPDITFVSNGKKQWTQFGRSYRVRDGASPEELNTILEPWDGFYAATNSLYEEALRARKDKKPIVVRPAGRERVDGVLCDKIQVDIKDEYNGNAIETRKTVFLRPDGLVRRQIMTFLSRGSGYTATADLIRIEKNPDLRTVKYAYTPPKGIALEVPHKEEPLLAKGTPAPDFAVNDKDGKAMRLSDLKGKVVVLDFWASWCGPCMASMPHTQSVADKLQKEGLPVVVLAVDDGETSADFAAWAKKTGTKYPALTFAYSPQKDDVSGKLFKVTGIPTQYVIDASGNICASFVGFGGPTDDLEKAVRAALKP